MPVSIARPVSTVHAQGWSTVGGSSVHQVLASTSDTSYVQGAGIGIDSLTVMLGIVGTVPAGARVARIRPVHRSRRMAAGAELAQRIGFGATNVQWTPVWTVPAGPIDPSIQNRAGVWWPDPSQGLPAAGWDGLLRTQLTRTAGGTVRVYQLSVEVEWFAPPTVTVEAPTGTVTDTTRPLLEWSLSGGQPDFGQSIWEVQVFSEVDEPAGGWPASPSEVAAAPVMTLSGTGPATQTALADPEGVGLDAHGSYRVYVRAGQPWWYGGPAVFMSPWVTHQVTVDVDAPAPPILTVTPDGPNARTTVQVQTVGVVDTQHVAPGLFASTSNGNSGDWRGWTFEVSQACQVTALYGTRAATPGPPAYTALYRMDPDSPLRLAEMLAQVEAAAGSGVHTRHELAQPVQLVPGVRYGLLAGSPYGPVAVQLAQTTSASILALTNATVMDVWVPTPGTGGDASYRWATSGMPDGLAGATGVLVSERGYNVGMEVEVAADPGDGHTLLQYSDDGGATWSPVRGPDPAPHDVVAQDYEAPFGRERLYRAQTVSTEHGPEVASGWAQAAGMLDARGVWLTEPVGMTVHTRVEPTAIEHVTVGREHVHRPPGMKAARIERDVPGAEVRLGLQTVDTWPTTWDTVQAAIESGRTLLLRTPRESIWVAWAGDRTRSESGTEWAWRDEWQGTLPVVDRP